MQFLCSMEEASLKTKNCTHESNATGNLCSKLTIESPEQGVKYVQS